MAQADEGHQQRQHERMSVSNNFSEDLLQKFMSTNRFNHKICEETEEEEEDEDVELSLGLSLNGRFGVDPRAKKLTRASSIPDFINPERDNGNSFMAPLVSNNLVRTCSLPTETDEEWRKRKEIQMLRRMEAKRKRSEKQRNLKAQKDRIKGFGEESCEEDKRENGTISKNHHHRQELFVKNCSGLFGAGAEGLLPRAQITAPSQGSTGSQGTGSSGLESENQHVQGNTFDALYIYIHLDCSWITGTGMILSDFTFVFILIKLFLENSHGYFFWHGKT